MPKKKKNNRLLVVLLLIFVVAIILGLAYFAFNYLGGSEPEIEVVGAGVFKQVDGATIKSLGELRACGNWPILTVSPDEQRGNPFYLKNLEVVPMIATGTVECLQIKRK